MRGALLAGLLLPLGWAFAGADEDWDVILELDEGPQVEPASRDEALRMARAHFDRHRAAIKTFIRDYPDDPRVFDGRLRLTSIDATEGSMENKPALVADALRDLMRLEKAPGISRERLADVTFRRISLQMQTITGREQEIREAVVVAASNFAARFPEDKRSPRLLVEAATLCDEVPDTMRDLLTRAQSLSREPALDARIADDFRRMAALGRPVEARFKTIDGRTIDVERMRGQVVVMIFWAAESPHCLVWMRDFLETLRKIPKEELQIVTVSLDEERANLDNAMRAFEIDWPTYFDGKGWESAVARPLGINALPTVWVIDKRGILRVLNARQSFLQWIRKLQLERG
ncbi:MAG: TlpA disulfide reductase family protein [Chthoniobacterales bacterium]